MEYDMISDGEGFAPGDRIVVHNTNYDGEEGVVVEKYNDACYAVNLEKSGKQVINVAWLRRVLVKKECTCDITQLVWGNGCTCGHIKKYEADY